MKSLTGFLLLAIVGTALADSILYPRGCMWENGRCLKACEVGTIPYTYGCGYLLPEPTCAKPDRKPQIGGYSLCTVCYCSPPAVRHLKSKKCVPLEECSKQ